MSSQQQSDMEYLFTYGTLQLTSVQLSTFGRKLEGKPDALVGYRLVMIKIQDEDFVAKSGTADHRNLQFTGNASDIVEGMVFKVTWKNSNSQMRMNRRATSASRFNVDPV